MSVYEKMTAIADKIRALLGITGAMGLDAMASNLAAEQTNIANAFAAVEEKDGTLPQSLISGNLASAIASIPEGVAIQKKTGTVTTNYSGSASANVGFKPDVVAFDGGANSNGTSAYPGAMFAESGKTKLSVIVSGPSTSYLFTDLDITQTSNGFSVSAVKLSTTGSPSADTNRRLSYTAMKYT